MALNQTGIQNALSISTVATALTLPAGLRPSHAIIQVTGGDIRWRADGTAPTASAGILVQAGSNIEFMDEAAGYTGIISRFQAIRATGVDATLECAFFSK